jgi:hypothetical protein|tara:strand:+ start:1284 stop:1457 length:174 start_codon:yes stop_codon:yes gene_type:complete
LRRGRKTDPRQYIEMRMEQLKEDRWKASDTLDRQWYWRIIKELEYVRDIIDEKKVDK